MTIDDKNMRDTVNKAKDLALDIVHQINDKTPDMPLFDIFSDITASYVMAFSFLTTHFQKATHEKPSNWHELKENAHKSLDVAFISLEHALPIYEDKIKNHANH